VHILFLPHTWFNLMVSPRYFFQTFLMEIFFPLLSGVSVYGKLPAPVREIWRYRFTRFSLNPPPSFSRTFIRLLKLSQPHRRCESLCRKSLTFGQISLRSKPVGQSPYEKRPPPLCRPQIIPKCPGRQVPPALAQITHADPWVAPLTPFIQFTEYVVDVPHR